MNEAETRAEYIDPALKEAGWNVLDRSRIKREFPITKGRLIGHGKRESELTADYVLQFKNRNLAVIEAKRRDLPYTEGAAQAKNYADRLQIRFTYCTNGEKIYGIDMHLGTESDVNAFPSPEELWQMTYGAETEAKPVEAALKDRLLNVPFENRGGTWELRYYQTNAVTKVLEAVAAGKRRILLTLATGTGKTAIAFQIVWKLFKSKWNLKGDGVRSPRILFLADRNLLADQAFRSFSSFEEDALVRFRPSDVTKTGKVGKNGSVFFTIFQSFMSGPNGSPFFGEYEPDFFDFIIIDECHRGGANDEGNWRAIMEHFSPAVQLGLTATPKRKENSDTYRYFGEPVYIYSLKEGINDGFLTPFRVKQISTTGDDYIYTSDDQVVEGEIEEGKVYGIEDQNKVIEIMGIERYRVETFMSKINQTEKTIVFCASQVHALAIRDLINQTVRDKNSNYCERVTADDGKLGEQHLADFQNNERKYPTVLTTSQKLSTGVDAPEIRNIVLLRPIKQLIEFKQIIGRGTRLYEGKDYFTVYDFVKAYLNFQDPDWDGEPLEPETVSSKEENIPCTVCGHSPCICAREPKPHCIVCNRTPCICEFGERRMIKIILADGKARELQHMISTSFWNPAGKPISSEEFLQTMFGTLPSFFKDEAELQTIWSRPDTRRKLLDELHQKGFGKAQLEELQKALNAEGSDLYDVLAYIAFHSSMIARAERASNASIDLQTYSAKQQVFLNFVLRQYVRQGVDELDDGKLRDLLVLKYHAIDDAKRDLGTIAKIRSMFIDFQSHLYEKKTAV